MNVSPNDPIINQLHERIQMGEDCHLVLEDLLVGVVQVLAIILKSQARMTGSADPMDLIMQHPDRKPRVLPAALEGNGLHKMLVSQLTGEDFDLFVLKQAALRETRRLVTARAAKEAEKAKKISGLNGPGVGVSKSSRGGALGGDMPSR